MFRNHYKVLYYLQFMSTPSYKQSLDLTNSLNAAVLTELTCDELCN